MRHDEVPAACLAGAAFATCTPRSTRMRVITFATTTISAAALLSILFIARAALHGRGLLLVLPTNGPLECLALELRLVHQLLPQPHGIEKGEQLHGSYRLSALLLLLLLHGALAELGRAASLGHYHRVATGTQQLQLLWGRTTEHAGNNSRSGTSARHITLHSRRHCQPPRCLEDDVAAWCWACPSCGGASLSKPSKGLSGC